MKELEATQEVVLLRDAIIIAAAQGSDFRNEESSEICAEILKTAVDGVEMMLGVDCEDPEAKNLARNTMHELIFYKTMMSSDDLDEAELLYCKHACGSLPDIGWQTYVRCIKACGWIDLAEVIWNQRQKVVIDRILCALRSMVMMPDFLEIFYTALRARLNSVCNMTSTEEKITTLDYIGQQLSYLTTFCEKTIVEPILKHCVISSLRFLSYFSMHLPAITDKLKNTIETALRYLVALLKIMLQSVASPTDFDMIYAVENCAAAIRDSLAKLNNSQPLTSFLDFVEKMNAGQSEDLADDEKHLSMYIESITLRDFMQEAAIEKLLSSLQSNVDLAVINCLLLNSDALNPRQVSALLLQTENMAAPDAAKIQQIVHKAYSDWDFIVQDSFRGEWHLKYGFREFIFAETDFSHALTEAINMLYSAGDKEITVAKEVSFLCLQSPAVALTRLFDFGVQSGQADTVAQILGILKASFCFVHNCVSFSHPCITRRILSDKLSSQELVSLSNLVEALIRSDVLIPAELVTTCIVPNLVPSPTCHRFLRLLWVIMKLNTGLKQIFEITTPPVMTLQLCKLLHYCMTVNLAAIRWDVLEVKEPLIATLNLMLDWMGTNVDSEANAVHKTCWLWAKLNELDSIILPYLLNLFASHNFESLFVKKVQRMSQPCLLLYCLCQKEKDSVILSKCRQRLSVDRITMSATIAMLLPRLLASEVEMLLHELAHLFTDITTNANFTPLVCIMLVLDSLMILAKHGGSLLPEPQWNRMAQTCITSFKAFLLQHQPISSWSLAALASVICHAAEETNFTFRATAGIFLMDLIGQADLLENEAFSCTLRAINRLGDENLTNHALKLLESKGSV